MSKVTLKCDNCSSLFVTRKYYHDLNIEQKGNNYIKLCRECRLEKRRTVLHVTVICETCKKEFIKSFKGKNKKDICDKKHFCCRSCNITYQNSHRKSDKYSKKEINCEQCGIKIVVSKFSSEKKCLNCKPRIKRKYSVYKTNYSILKKVINCKLCKKDFTDKYLSTKKYCDKCRYLVQRESGLKSVKVQSKTRRSKNEKFFAELCKEFYDNITFNEPFFKGELGYWDADIILHDYKIAILWNGIWHYKKVRKKHSVKQVQTRDKIKLKLIKKNGYTPYIVKDMGKFDPQFVNEEFNKFKLFIEDLSSNFGRPTK